MPRPVKFYLLLLSKSVLWVAFWLFIWQYQYAKIDIPNFIGNDFVLVIFFTIECWSFGAVLFFWLLRNLFSSNTRINYRLYTTNNIEDIHYLHMRMVFDSLRDKINYLALYLDKYFYRALLLSSWIFMILSTGIAKGFHNAGYTIVGLPFVAVGIIFVLFATYKLQMWKCMLNNSYWFFLTPPSLITWFFSGSIIYHFGLHAMIKYGSIVLGIE